MTILALICVQFFFGSLPAATKIALTECSPYELMLLRTGGALLVFGGWVLQGKASGSRNQGPHSQNTRPVRHSLRDHFILFTMALCGASFNQFLLFEGLMAAGAVIPAIVVPTIPLFTVILAVLAKQESFHRGKFFAVIVGLLGVGILALPFGGHNETVTAAPHPLLGTTLCVLSAVLTAAFFVMKRPMAQRVGAKGVLFPVYTYGFIICVGLWFFNQPDETSPSLLNTLSALGFQRALEEIPERFWYSLAFIVLGATIVSNILNTWAIKRIPASTVTGFIFLQTLVGISVGSLLLDEAITLRHSLAACTLATSLGLLCRLAWVESHSGRIAPNSRPSKENDSYSVTP